MNVLIIVFALLFFDYTCRADEVLAEKKMNEGGLLVLIKSKLSLNENNLVKKNSKVQTGINDRNEFAKITCCISNKNGLKVRLWEYIYQVPPPAVISASPSSKSLESSFNPIDFGVDVKNGIFIIVWNSYDHVFATVVKCPPNPGQMLIKDYDMRLKDVKFNDIKNCNIKVDNGEAKILIKTSNGLVREYAQNGNLWKGKILEVVK